jgi:transcriptional regulator with PAS, ATPase and Fis domain
MGGLWYVTYMGERPPGDSTRIRSPRMTVRYAKVRIEVAEGPETGKHVVMAGQLVRVGTADDNDLVLLDDTVSRYHCELEAAPGGVRVRDGGSTNGVMVNGVRFYDAVLPLSSRLRLGDTTLAIVPLGESVEREQTMSDRFGDLVGCAPRTRELFADLERIAGMDVTVLIEGETGTGKDVVAESIHGASARSEGPFIVFDCGAVSPTLAESELFGHERGAFTGATNQHQGVFEQADGGTLFLDEIGELPKELQPKLLRVLEKRHVRRVGGTKVIPFDARILAATNRHLRAEVQRGGFREDLYFRLAAAHVVVPPLRDRMDDLPLLADHFLAREKPPRTVGDLPRHVWELFLTHRWPGNVRELRNAIQQLLAMPDRSPLSWTTDDPTPARPSATPAAELLPLRIARREAIDTFERSYLSLALARAGGSVTRAAAIAEVSRQILSKLLQKHGRE